MSDRSDLKLVYRLRLVMFSIADMVLVRLQKELLITYKDKILNKTCTMLLAMNYFKNLKYQKEYEIFDK